MAGVLSERVALRRRQAEGVGVLRREVLPPPPTGPEWGVDERDLVWPVVQEKDFLQKMMRAVLQTLVEAERTAPWMVEWLEALAVPEAAKAGAESAPAGAETVEPSGPSEEPEESTEA